MIANICADFMPSEDVCIENSARAEICAYARKHFRSPLIVEFGTYVDLIACTPPDIIKPGDILRNPSGALEG